MSSFPWLTVLVLLPLVGAVVLWVLPAAPRNVVRPVALALPKAS